MRSYQVFAAMSADRALSFLRGLSENSPQIYKQAVDVASATMNARPAYLRKQPIEKQAQAVRRGLSRVASNAVAEELLAMYFLECRKDLLIEWLEVLSIEHDEGTLKDDAPAAPDAQTLAKAHDDFCSKDDDGDRKLLIEAFAAQSAIDWPDLDVVIESNR